ncbi:MAG: hypothetical protein UV55_C0005G0050 [Candidatus Gottesmanbacteria bacterium GW2011_GWC1_43_10]|nr:MAG: hypothetical protein UV04_C0009G0067 [Candidatus Gottesmanbacteria bacterium GW2011_GWA2_42_16]KKS54942.1 MAG: hypothetical protein UV17_C0014G0025 [Candidatus Gottesmanbacteria bacterium GW2011_GWA1_42_26]KKS82132.1 MAG: hypothetical protein UV55_C0005G0050 [Candidatus Gottesmanbacteria bacterium GW2011_GWC1_43_10]
MDYWIILLFDAHQHFFEAFGTGVFRNLTEFFGFLFAQNRRRQLGLLHAFLEALDLALGIGVAHLTGKERMAFGADFSPNFRLGGADSKGIAAGTNYGSI